MQRQSVFDKILVTIGVLSTGGMYASGAGVFIMSVLITIEITGRYLFGFSLLVVDEWSGYLLVMVTFLGLAYTMKTKGFLQIDFLVNRLSQRRRHLFNIFLVLIALIYSLVIGWKLIIYTWLNYSTGAVSVSISQTPLYIPQLFMPLGILLLVLELIREAITSIQDFVTLKSCQKMGSGLER
jgi:TRAP-type C4-dicarboxylate transport system permease small subunit